MRDLSRRKGDSMKRKLNLALVTVKIATAKKATGPRCLCGCRVSQVAINVHGR